MVLLNNNLDPRCFPSAKEVIVRLNSDTQARKVDLHIHVMGAIGGTDGYHWSRVEMVRPDTIEDESGLLGQLLQLSLVELNNNDVY